jgi:Plasmid replication region DNA-binding N-term
MSFDEVRQAVEAIEAEGGTPSVRAVIAKIGGSSRDVQKYLKLLRDPTMAELRDVIEQTLAVQQVQIDTLIAEVEARDKPALEALMAEVEARMRPQLEALMQELRAHAVPQGRRNAWAVPLPGAKATPPVPPPMIPLDVVRRLAVDFAGRRDRLTPHRAAAWLSTPTCKLEAKHMWEAIAREVDLTPGEAAAVRQKCTELSHGLVWADREDARVADGVWQRHVLDARPSRQVGYPEGCSWARTLQQERSTLA